MAGWIADIGRVTIGLDDPGQDIDGGEDFKRAIDRCSPDARAGGAARHLGHELLRAERATMTDHGVDHGRSRLRYPISELLEHRFHIGSRKSAILVRMRTW